MSDIVLGLKDIKDDTTEIKELLKNFKPGVSFENEGEHHYLRQQREKFRKANLLERCIEHEVADRPQHFQEVLDVLATVADELDPVKRQQREQEEQERRRKVEQSRQRAEQEQQRLAAVVVEEQRQREQAEVEQRQREAEEEQKRQRDEQAAVEQRQREAAARQRDAELRQQSEEKLLALHLVALDRTHGQHFAQDAELRQQFRIPDDLAEQIRQKALGQWHQVNPPKKERQPYSRWRTLDMA